MTPLDLGGEKLVLYRRQPQIMVRELFGVIPDPWQDEALEDFPHCPRQAMAACKGPGKTTLLAWLAWNYLLTRPEPKIGAVSITGGNLDDNLWPEMSKWQQRTPILREAFEWTTKSIFLKARPETWFMSHKSWSKTANTEELGQTLAGLWADHVLFLIDECGGVPVPIMRTAEAVLQNQKVEGHIVIAGNTNSTTGCLYDAMVTNRSLWQCYHITGDPEDPKRTPRINIEYAKEQIKKFGRDDPWIMINLLAKFPTQGVNQLISAQQVIDCVGRHLHQHAYDWAPKILGGDIADFGDDKTVFFPRQGLAYFSPLVLRKMDPVEIAGHAMQKASQWGASSIQIDATGGYGTGPIAIMRSQGFTVLAVQFAGEPRDPKFYNKRAEIWWEACEHIKQGASLPSDCPDLVAELSSATYSYKGDRIVLEPKELMKQRLGRSPDYADALCCTHAYPAAVTRDTSRSLYPFDFDQNVSKAKVEYDPLARI